ncbi:ATP synthase subunit delta, mitochondrial [Eurytemora carolleeae]|uniref:ATP synthase subunit delta, mitochondrial n=1 Tax=Eurytemora carolleeae TaxID=1294199 RepID=UPI000C75AF0D|nr:ATP synthase subunit delta, mitochondrial [Eurytemora carolleeae]|eukprot:XP_023326417.1 ATP synthase subunit delta, mitochondrial-like [Eurytemora affinis]
MAFRTAASLSLRRMMSTSAPRNADMAFTFAAPNAVHYNAAAVKQIDVPSFSGSFGILPAHVPTLAVLKPGVVTVYEEDGTSKKFFVSSGSVTINEDSSVQILAEEAHPIENLDAAGARQVLADAQAALNAANTEVERAEAQIAIEVGEALVSAAQ